MSENGKTSKKIAVVTALIVAITSALAGITGFVRTINPAGEQKADLAYELLKKDIEHVKEVVAQQHEDFESMRMLMLVHMGDKKEAETSPLETELMKELIDKLDTEETVVKAEASEATEAIDAVEESIEEEPEEKMSVPEKKPLARKSRSKAKKFAPKKDLFQDDLPQDLNMAIQQKAAGYGPQPDVAE